MDCKHIEEILIDYVEDFLDPDKREILESHLSVCPQCSEKLEDYTSIKNAFNEEDLPKVSQSVIDKLTSEAYRRQNKKSFWKRWFYSPILIPALSTAIALMIWLDSSNNRYRGFDNPQSYSREVMAKKIPQGEINENLAGSKQNSDYEINDGIIGREARSNISSDINIRIDNDFKYTPEEEKTAEKDIEGESVLEQPLKKSGAVIYDDYNYNAVKEIENRSINSGKPEPVYPEYPDDEGGRQTNRDKIDMFAKNHADSENQYRSPSAKDIEGDYELYSNENLKSRDDIRLKKLDAPEVVIDKTYIDELNDALREQKSGNCYRAIKLNEKIINNKPAPSNKIKEQSYLSIAECYEQQKKYREAIENYNLLQEVAPSQTTFATKKINELKLKIQISDESEINSESSK